MTEMQVTLIDHMGTDLTVVNAARVSFDSESDWELDCDYVVGDKLLERDKKLINFLARNRHFTTFTHCMVTFRVKAPIFVARQLWKSHVGLAGGDYGPIGWNEISRRYVNSEPEFYTPEVWRGKPKNAKQGSSGVVNLIQDGVDTVLIVAELNDNAHMLYTRLLNIGVAPEQARMVLPQSLYTEWYWTGSLAAFARICQLRLEDKAQSETHEVAQMIADFLEPLFPVSWKALLLPTLQTTGD